MNDQTEYLIQFNFHFSANILNILTPDSQLVTDELAKAWTALRVSQVALYHVIQDQCSVVYH